LELFLVSLTTKALNYLALSFKDSEKKKLGVQVRGSREDIMGFLKSLISFL
jgi:hypothetical protein